jgi:uncharacterized membrane protein HdeD (DUF308 family)
VANVTGDTLFARLNKGNAKMTVMRAIGLCLGLLMLISQVHAVYTEAFFWVQGVICVSVGVIFVSYGLTGRDYLRRLSVATLGNNRNPE